MVLNVGGGGATAMVDDVADDEECWGIMSGGLECDGQWGLLVVGRYKANEVGLQQEPNQTKTKNNIE